MKRSWLILAILLVLVTNAIALVGVWRNRAGAPVETIELTERELPLQSMGQDNSGVGLLLAWTRTPIRNQETEFTRAQLEGIGFDFRIPAETPGKDVSLLPRAAFAVLEYDGKAYQQWAERWSAEALAKKQESPNPGSQAPRGMYDSDDPQTTSRLFPIDIGNNLMELRSRYPDQSKYLIVSAVIRARIEGPAGAPPRCTGYVQQILPFYINVPLPYSRILAQLKPQAGKAPRYSVILSYGHNLEPWVTSIRLH
jgi:hypothetical protein